MPQPRAFLNGLKTVWWFIRQVSGDAAYENYLRYAARQACANGANNDGAPAISVTGPVTAQEFYLEEIRRKFSRISRCC